MRAPNPTRTHSIVAAQSRRRRRAQGSQWTSRFRRRPSTTTTPEASLHSHGARTLDVWPPRALLPTHRRLPVLLRRLRCRQPRFRPPLTRTPALVGSSRTPLSNMPPHCSPDKPCLAEHHRQDATAEKAGEGPGCNFFFFVRGCVCKFSRVKQWTSKCITNHRKILKMQTQLIWNLGNKIYKFCNNQICRNPTKFNLWKRIRKPTNACSGSSTQQMTMIFGYVVSDGMLG